MTFNKLYIKTICRVYRSYYKGYMDKTKGKGGGDLAGVGWRDGEKMQTTVIE